MNFLKFVEYAGKIDRKEHLSMCKSNWLEFLNDKNPRDRSSKDFFDICVRLEIFVLDTKKETICFKLCRNYSDKIREFYDNVEGGKFKENLEKYYKLRDF